MFQFPFSPLNKWRNKVTTKSYAIFHFSYSTTKTL